MTLPNDQLTQVPVKYTFIIPSKDRSASVQRLLLSLYHLRYDRKAYEVIIVDDGSSLSVQREYDAMAGHMRWRGLQVRVLHCSSNKGQGNARNIGLENAQGDWVIYTDDDCAPDVLFLEVLNKYTTSEKLVAGRAENALYKNIYSEASQSALNFIYDWLNGLGRVGILGGFNMVMPKHTLMSVGAFALSRFDEDRELLERWKDRSLPVEWAPDLIVYHASNLTFKRLVRQWFHTYGRGATQFKRLRHTVGKSCSLMESYPLRPSKILKYIQYPFTKGVSRPCTVAVLMVLVQLAYMVGIIVEVLSPKKLSLTDVWESTSEKAGVR